MENDKLILDDQRRFHELFWERDLAILKAPLSSQDEILKVMENIGFYPVEDRAELNILLSSHSLVNKELLEKGIRNLEVLWWGDDPMECRLGIETLKKLLR